MHLDLFNWLMNHGKPADAELEQMVRLIRDTESGTWSCGNLIYASHGALSDPLLIHGLVAAGVTFIDAPAAELCTPLSG